MLYDLNWLEPGEMFPPASERDRLEKYRINEMLYKGAQFDASLDWEVMQAYITRLHKYIGRNDLNITNTIFPVVLNYQQLISLKKADLVCGEPPEITGIDSSINDLLTELRRTTSLDTKLAQTVIDMSRYGDAIWRIFKDEFTGKGNFAVWAPKNWYPVMLNDGTNRVKAHVLTWIVNKGTSTTPKYELNAQIHSTAGGSYEHRIYAMKRDGKTIDKLLQSEFKNTGEGICQVLHLPHNSTTSSVYGYDDYESVDSLLCELMVRIAQVSNILDKHASPAMTGPTSMLSKDPETGELYLKVGQFYAVAPEDEQPKYLTWDGQLDAAFKEIEVLLNQLWVISEMGATLLGTHDALGQAVSGTAMRSKMASPLIAARRITNTLTFPLMQLVSIMLKYDDKDIPPEELSIEWNDGLPTDPREDAELAKLVTGLPQLMPLKEAITEYLHKSTKEANRWASDIQAEQKIYSTFSSSSPEETIDVDPREKGSEMGLSDFSGTNK